MASIEPVRGWRNESRKPRKPAASETRQQRTVSWNPIGRYKLLEQIGEGGFGVVFMAQQEEPVRRKVALKIIKPGMDTKEVIARFEAERQRRSSPLPRLRPLAASRGPRNRSREAAQVNSPAH